ncbi:hypothetical protein ACX1C1_19605 [Paenibacillus sp. strain BS8-2]
MNGINTKSLREWFHKHNIEKRTIESFWNTFNTYRSEDTDEFNEVFFHYSFEKLKITIEDVSLHVKEILNPNPNDYRREYIQVRVRMDYLDKALGYYRIIYSIDGQIEDDYFISEWVGYRPHMLMGLLDDLLDEMNHENKLGYLNETDLKKISAILIKKKFKIKNEFMSSYSCE